ncbi:alcohol dehydrogenase class IV [Nocardioides sp. BE266]|uniref:iron-containing alcohol dehydrogenase n=1 Tax=Nocardioides sp. BE266 TaxID=2817725 RepID=UPI002854D76E|nr:iron-containing alcohol dehydrogenase [Nocardioides sp. BE266]MDR7255099.1 alcohol dehydrogenase class IV [Nocardioides sp. BE266]
MGFTHETLPQRVRFAAGEADAAVREEVELLGARRAMVIASPRGTEVARAVTAGIEVAVLHDGVREHVPLEIAEAARAVAAEHDVDVVVSVGGGSATGLGKAVALTTGLPLVAVPTTYAGSEATDVWGLTTDGTKTTGTDRRVLPRSVVYDAALTRDLPAGLTTTSGLNALAHAVDALWAPRADPINAALAGEGVRALAVALPAVLDAPHDLTARERVLYGTYLASAAFASSGSGLHHKICHVLGGRFDLPHAATHAIVLPHVLALNAPHAPAADRRLAEAFGSTSAVLGLADLYDRLDAPRSLAELGLRDDQVAEAAAAILPSVPPSNPAPVDLGVLEVLLRSALHG